MLYLQVASLPQLFASCACLPELPARPSATLEETWHLLFPVTPLQPPTPLPHTLLAQAIKQELVCGAVILIAVKSDTCSTNQVTKTENYGVIHKMRTRKGEE